MSLHTILRAFHILTGALWVGAAVFNAGFLIPAVTAAGPAGGQVMRVMVQVRRLPVFMNSVMGIALISGIWLYGWDSGGFQAAWITTNPGMAYTFGALCALATAALGHVVILRTVKRVAALGAAIAGSGGPPSPEQAAEMAALQRRMLKWSRAGSALLVVATVAMAVARFL